MATPRQTSTLVELIRRGRSQILSTIGQADISDGSDYGLLGAMLGYMSKGLQDQIAKGVRHLNPARASGIHAREWGSHFGVDVDKAKVVVVLLCRGVTGAGAIAAGQKFQTADGRTYTNLSGALSVSSAALNDIIRVGEGSNRYVIRSARRYNGAAVSPIAGNCYQFTHPVLGTSSQAWFVASDQHFDNAWYCYPPLDFEPEVNFQMVGTYGLICLAQADDFGTEYQLDRWDQLTYVGGTPSGMATPVRVGGYSSERSGVDAPSDGDLRNAIIELCQGAGIEFTEDGLADLLEDINEHAPKLIFQQVDYSNEGLPGEKHAIVCGSPETSEFAPSSPYRYANFYQGLPHSARIINSSLQHLDAAEVQNLTISIRVNAENAPPFKDGVFTATAVTNDNTVTLTGGDATDYMEVGDYVLFAIQQEPTAVTPADVQVLQRKLASVAAGSIVLDGDIVTNAAGLLYFGPGSKVVPEVIEVVRHYLRTFAVNACADSGNVLDWGPRGEHHIELDTAVLAARIEAIQGVTEASVAYNGATGTFISTSESFAPKWTELKVLPESESY